MPQIRSAALISNGYWLLFPVVGALAGISSLIEVMGANRLESKHSRWIVHQFDPPPSFFISILSMTNMKDRHYFFFGFNFINDAIVADPDAIAVFRALEFFCIAKEKGFQITILWR